MHCKVGICQVIHWAFQERNTDCATMSSNIPNKCIEIVDLSQPHFLGKFLCYAFLRRHLNITDGSVTTLQPVRVVIIFYDKNTQWVSIDGVFAICRSASELSHHNNVKLLFVPHTIGFYL